MSRRAKKRAGFPLAAALLLSVAGCAQDEGEVDANGGAGGKADDPFAQDGASIYAVGNRLDPWDGEDAFLDEVQPVLAQRCVTCHSCGDSPCQLKFSSFEALSRGSNEDNLYAPRVFGIDHEYNPQNIDHGRVMGENGLVDFAKTEETWRDLDFYSVINRGTDAVLARVLTEAQDATTSLDQSYEVGQSLNGRKFECVGSDNPRESKMVGRAMPLGMPALPEAGTATMLEWLDAGAAPLTDEAQRGVGTPANAAAVEEWENFFNPANPDERDQLISRYMYEHMFFAHLHLERSPGEFYRIVRSRTLTGPIDQINTELINDEPDDDGPIYYRLMKMTEVLAAKQHIVWEIGPDELAKWQASMFDGDWELTRHDEYRPNSTNPFAYFAAIPANVRYRFMMENSREMIDAMVRGSVCIGSGATFAIRDRFWVWFLDPDSDPSALEEVAGEETHGPLLGESSWFHLNPHEADTLREIDYLRAYRRYLQQHRPDGLAVEDLWDGDGGTNPDAWITVARHGTTSSVTTGPQYGQPETVWVLGYSNFERLYYNLVVEFETWAGVGHKLETWGLMSMVRSEGEDLFLTMLPPDVREEMREHKTRGWGAWNDILLPDFASCSGELEDIIGDDCLAYSTSVEYDVGELETIDERIDAHVADVAQQVREHIGGAALDEDPLNEVLGGDPPEEVRSREDVEAAFNLLTGWQNPGWEHVPEATLIRVHNGDSTWIYTMLANRIYLSHDRVYFEGLTRVPEEDSISFARSVVGARPNLFIDVKMDAVPELVASLMEVESAEDWAALWSADFTETGFHLIDRQDEELWTFADAIHAQWFAEDPINAAVLDLSEYVWPQDL